MSTYNLSQTAAEIDSAIGKVHNADTTPTQGSTNMVTSDGVFDAVNSIGISALPIITEVDGITNYDNDQYIPTNAAVKDYVDSKTPSLLSATKSTQTVNTDTDVSGYTLSGSGISESSGTVTITGAGVWIVRFYIKASLSSTNYNAAYNVEFYLNNSVAHYKRFSSTAESTFNDTLLVNSTNSFTVKIRADELAGSSSCTINDATIQAVKL